MAFPISSTGIDPFTARSGGAFNEPIPIKPQQSKDNAAGSTENLFKPLRASRIDITQLTAKTKAQFDAAILAAQSKKIGLTVDQQKKLKFNKNWVLASRIVIIISFIAIVVLALAVSVLTGQATFFLYVLLPISFLILMRGAGILERRTLLSIKTNEDYWNSKIDLHNKKIEYGEISPLQKRRAYWDDPKFLKYITKYEIPPQNLVTDNAIYEDYQRLKEDKEIEEVLKFWGFDSRSSDNPIRT